jgi:pimeloyl-[acyl-carrier protein] methyl ester esterase
MDGTSLFFGPLLDALPVNLSTHPVAYPPDKNLTYEELAAFVVKSLPDGPVVILAESFSGPVGVLVAQTCAEQVKALILAASFVRTPIPRVAGLLLAVPFALSISKYFAPLVLLGRRRDRQLSSELQTVLAAIPSSLLRFRSRLVLNADYSARFQDLGCPTLILTGSNDILVGRRSAKALRELRPDADSFELPAAHMLLQTRASECATSITTFLERSDIIT